MKKLIIIILLLWASAAMAKGFFPFNLRLGGGGFHLPDIAPCEYLVDGNGDYLQDNDGNYLYSCPDTDQVTIGGADVTIGGATINIYE